MAFVRRPRRGGFGDVSNCPSLEQLMGISDPADPCQSTQQSQVPTETPYPVVTSVLPSTSPLAGVQSFFSANPMAMWGIGAALAVVVAGAVFGGRQR